MRSGWSVEALINIVDVTNSSSCLICSHTKTESKITVTYPDLLLSFSAVSHCPFKMAR